MTALCFGTMEVALKIGGSTFTALQMNFLRFLIGGLLLLPLALKELKCRQITLTLADWGYMTLLGVLGISFSMSFFQISVMHLNANTAAIMICIMHLSCRSCVCSKSFSYGRGQYP